MIELYSKALQLAQKNNQVVGEKSDYYVTVAQLERLLKASADFAIPDFDEWAGNLHDQVHEPCALVTTDGKDCGWAPEDSIPMLSEALLKSFELGLFERKRRDGKL